VKTYPVRRADGRVVRVTVPDDDDVAARLLAEAIDALRRIKRIADRRGDRDSMDVSAIAGRVLLSARKGA